jgi:4-hydroxy-3-methylbut-2-en-1-yl diphosphate reductase
LVELIVATATRLETWAARRTLPRTLRVARVGMGLKGGTPLPLALPFVSCGLAGALSPALRPGTVLIPEWVGLPSGEWRRCDVALARALEDAARSLGFVPLTAPLITTPHLVTGRDRDHWRRRGFVAADMETGLLLARNPCGAAVRIVLDSPWHELAANWVRPGRALLTPRLWPQTLRLGLTAPRYALRAAAVVRAALDRQYRQW